MSTLLDPGPTAPAAGEAGTVATGGVTRDVEVAALADLVENPPRATLAFVDRGAIQVLPVTARLAAGRHLFSLPFEPSPDLEGLEVVLVIDDGWYWFELRGMSVHGTAKRVDPATAEASRSQPWYAIEPRRLLAWDYGTIREV